MRLTILILAALGAAAALYAALTLPATDPPAPRPRRADDCETALRACEEALDERAAAQRVLRCLAE